MLIITGNSFVFEIVIVKFFEYECEIIDARY